jgi:hypothetical protein
VSGTFSSGTRGTDRTYDLLLASKSGLFRHETGVQPTTTKPAYPPWGSACLETILPPKPKQGGLGAVEVRLTSDELVGAVLGWHGGPSGSGAVQPGFTQHTQLGDAIAGIFTESSCTSRSLLAVAHSPHRCDISCQLGLASVPRSPTHFREV